MTITATPTLLTLTGWLGRDVQLALTARSEYSRTAYDPVTDGDVVYEGISEAREYAKLSLAVHEGYGRDPRGGRAAGGPGGGAALEVASGGV